MGVLVYILGRSGTGKSYSMRNFDPNKIALINVQGKILPFKNSGKIKATSTDDSDTIVRTIKGFANTYKSIVVDDFQYVMANEFMRRSTERGYDKFTEIGRHAWDIANCVKDLPSDIIVYIMCHTDTDQEGLERLKTVGKLLDEKIVLEGMSTIVLKTYVSDGKYGFTTQNNGKDTVKSPAGMFETYAIDNDLKYVDDKIRSYYGFEGAKSEAEMKKEDDEKKLDVQPEEAPKKRRGRPKKEEKSEKEKLDLATENGTITEDTDEEVDYLKRKEREEPEEAINKPEETQEETPAPTRRRRRRS